MAKESRKRRADNDPPAPVARPRRRSSAATVRKITQVRKFAIETARLLKDRHCEDVLLLDVHGRNDITDYILLASGTSDRQMRAVAEEIEQLASQTGMVRLGADIDAHTTWVVLDFIDLVVHLFDPATRAHYDLEMLWGDVPRVTWRKT